MGLARALLIPEAVRPPIPVLFNPSQYSIDASNQIAEIGVPGSGAPVLQYVRGGGRTMTMDLFFDTYEEGIDVRLFPSQVYALLDVLGPTHVPPVVIFTWGLVIFRCVVERVSGRFTMFLSEGTPVRATLSVTLKEYIDSELGFLLRPLESADRFKTYTV